MVLAHHLAREVGAHLAEVDRVVLVQDVGRQARHLRHRLDHLRGADHDRRLDLVPAGSRPVGRALEDVGDHAGRPGGAQVLLAIVQGRVARVRPDRDRGAVLQAVCYAPSELGELDFVEREQAHDLQVRAQGGAHLQRSAGPVGIGLRQDQQPAPGYGRPHLVQHRGRLARVRAAARQLLQVADAPRHLLADQQFGDGLADAALQLADVHLVGHQFGGRGLEHPPALVGEPPPEQAKEAGLAHPRAAGDQDRPVALSQHRRLGSVQDRAPGCGLDYDVVRFTRPEPAEAGQLGLVDPCRAPASQFPEQGGSIGMVDPLQEALDVIQLHARRLRQLAERRGVAQLGALLEVVAERLDQHGVVDPPLLGDCRRIAGRRTRVQAVQEAQTVVQGARGMGPELADAEIGQLLPIGATAQRLECRG